MHPSPIPPEVLYAAPQPGARRHFSPSVADPLEVRLSRVGDPGRERVEEFIARSFARAYGARLTHFMPEIISLHDDSGQVVAACGLRAAGDGPLFLESYLERPVEAAVTLATGRPVRRARVMEVGNLAAERPGLPRRLIATVARHLFANDYGWVVFTAVTGLRNTFGRLSVPLFPLAPADPKRLPAGAATVWGSYYERTPQVMAGDVHAGLPLLLGRAGSLA